MGTHEIPVDLYNPGQVLACLGFLEAADVLCGPAEGGFDWAHGAPKFKLRASGADNPMAEVLEFLADSEVIALVVSKRVFNFSVWFCIVILHLSRK